MWLQSRGRTTVSHQQAPDQVEMKFNLGWFGGRARLCNLYPCWLYQPLSAELEMDCNFTSSNQSALLLSLLAIFRRQPTSKLSQLTCIHQSALPRTQNSFTAGATQIPHGSPLYILSRRILLNCYSSLSLVCRTLAYLRIAPLDYDMSGLADSCTTNSISKTCQDIHAILLLISIC